MKNQVLTAVKFSISKT